MAKSLRPGLHTFAPLLFAGWHPWRDVLDRLNLPPDFDLFSAAANVLREYGGLGLGPANEFTRLEPATANDVATEIKKYATQVGRPLYPLGYREHQDREYILIDNRGVVYLMTDELRPMATTFTKTLRYLIWPSDYRRRMKKDLESYGLFGKVWIQSDGR